MLFDYQLEPKATKQIWLKARQHFNVYFKWIVAVVVLDKERWMVIRLEERNGFKIKRPPNRQKDWDKIPVASYQYHFPIGIHRYLIGASIIGLCGAQLTRVHAQIWIYPCFSWSGPRAKFRLKMVSGTKTVEKHWQTSRDLAIASLSLPDHSPLILANAR